jgi:hypothetical protein
VKFYFPTFVDALYCFRVLSWSLRLLNCQVSFVVLKIIVGNISHLIVLVKRTFLLDCSAYSIYLPSTDKF